MKFRVVRVFDGTPASPESYRVETEGKLTQADGVELANLLTRITDKEFISKVLGALDSAV